MNVSPGFTAGAWPGEARDVRAVGAELVSHAVEVHRVRAVRQRVQVAEVDEQRVADVGREQGALDPLVAGRVPDPSREVLRVLAVDDGAERRLDGREGVALDRVPLVRDDVPGDGNGRDPVLTDMAGLRRRRRRGQDVAIAVPATVATAPARAASASARGPDQRCVTA